VQSITPYKRCAIVIFTLKLTKDYRSVEKMFLRMCFHAFSHNRVDAEDFTPYRIQSRDKERFHLLLIQYIGIHCC